MSSVIRDCWLRDDVECLKMILIFVFVIGTSASQKFDFPLQGGVKPENRNEPVFHFEGVDYENLPTALKNRYTDCEAENIRCIRHQVALTPVCAFSLSGSGWRDLNNICEFQRQNCFAMRDKGRGKYGQDINSGWLFLQGEGFGCVHEFRRLKDSGLLKIYLKSLDQTA